MQMIGINNIKNIKNIKLLLPNYDSDIIMVLGKTQKYGQNEVIR